MAGRPDREAAIVVALTFAFFIACVAVAIYGARR
jgi:hypothetical protein